MNNGWAAVAIVLLVPLATPIGSSQGLNPCVRTSWTETSSVGRIVRPGLDEYHARVTFTVEPHCTPTWACVDRNQAEFEVTTAPPWADVNFTENPVAVTSTGTPPSNTGSNELLFRLERTAPFDEEFSIGVRARCGPSSVGSVQRVFRVGPWLNLTAEAIDAEGRKGAAEWVLRLTNGGDVALVATFHPEPDGLETGLEWAIPNRTVLPLTATGADASSFLLGVAVRGKQIPGDLSLGIWAHEAADENRETLRVEVPLPYVIFGGKSTPSVAAVTGIALLGLAAWRRRV